MCLAVPGRVEKIFRSGDALMGKVNFGGVIKDVCLEYVPDIEVGEYTIVHVGFALNKIDENSAKETLRTFRELGLLEEELESLRETDFESAEGPPGVRPSSSTETRE